MTLLSKTVKYIILCKVVAAPKQFILKFNSLSMPPHPLKACASGICLVSHLVGPHPPAKKNNLPKGLLSISPLKGNNSTQFCKHGSPCMRFEKFSLYFIHTIKFILVVSKHNFSLFVPIMMPLFAAENGIDCGLFFRHKFTNKSF